MARIFITGSTDGLGLMAAQLLSRQGHTVALHARNDTRARDARAALPDNAGVAVGDLSSIAQTRDVAAQVNDLGIFDAITTTPTSATTGEEVWRPRTASRTSSRSTCRRPTSSRR
ncbi:SDR family NAD(P)-dependent oxidoreductase [Streptomyces mirabilis]|uniref:SDR family NAD(P)-dependent oxidoreductase n=1 Tax=Streptomyces mirabilis TaxID=68239 RepID=UPI0036E13941